jgi:hypothetical protein
VDSVLLQSTFADCAEKLAANVVSVAVSALRTIRSCSSAEVLQEDVASWSGLCAAAVRCLFCDALLWLGGPKNNTP